MRVPTPGGWPPRDPPAPAHSSRTCPAHLGLLPGKRPQAVTFHPDPLLLGVSVSPSPPPTPQGEQELSCQPPPVLPPGVTPARTWSRPKRVRKWGVDTSGQVTSGGCAGTKPATSGAGRMEGQGPGHPGPGEGLAWSRPSCRPPRGPWRLGGLLPNPRAPRLGGAPWPAYACLLA